jgi:BON domain/YMGG-like Gly-zipper
MKELHRNHKTVTTPSDGAYWVRKARWQDGRWIHVVLAAIAALVIGGCSTSQRGPDDQQIISSIDSKLHQDPDLTTLSLNVTSKQGVVTLSGMVNAPVEKLAVEDVARETDGVKQVVEHLTMATAATETNSPAPSSEQAAAAPRQHHHPRRSDGLSAAETQTPRADEEAQNSSQANPDASAPAQDNSQPAPDNSGQAQANPQPAPGNFPQAQPNTQPGGASASAPAAAPAPESAASPPAAPPPQQVTVPSGTVVKVRMIDGISSGTAQPGEVYRASVSAPLMLDNQVVIPRGATARVRVVHVQSAGQFEGQPLLKLELVGFTVGGTKYSVKSAYYTKAGQSRGKNTAEKVGGGAGLGALLGAVVGHGKGAGIGAVIGAAAGTVDQRATHAQEVTISSEARIDFTLKSPVNITVSGGQ